MKTYAAITGVSGYVPDYVLTNEIITQIVDTSDEWIVERTGIKERRILKDPKLATSFMAIKAAEKLLKKTNTDPKTIDLVICATITPDAMFPNTANIVAGEIKASNAFSFDLLGACSGFLFSLVTATQYIVSGSCKKVLLIGADKMSSIVDYQDRKTCILFGDGAGAVLLEPEKGENGIMDHYCRSDSKGKDFLYMKAGGSSKPPSIETIIKKEHNMYQNGQKVFKYAVESMAEAITILLEKNNISIEDLTYLVPHQANFRIINYLSHKFQLPLEKIMINIDKYGNTTNATIPLCLYNYENKLQKGDELILCAFGGGFTWGSCRIKWSY